MTLTEAIARRIPRIRLPDWAPGTYLRLPLLPRGEIGPWAELYTPGGPFRQYVIRALHPDNYEAYTGPIAPEERENLAKDYTEK